MLKSNHKPRFALELTINELSNIPHVGGSCLIGVSIRDSKKSKFSFGSSGLSASNAAQAALENSKTSSKLRTLTSSSLSSGSQSRSQTLGNASGSSTSSQGAINAVTSNRRIHNFKCNFNYKINCNLKFPVKKKKNLIGNKYLVLTVFYMNEKGPGSSNTDDSSATEFGKVEVNLSEYLNFFGPTTSKYLLKDSKVNSILGITITLSEISANVDFHTQLQIYDNLTNHSNSSSSSATQFHPTTTSSSMFASGTTTVGSGRFNVPNFEKNAVFSGLNDVINQTNDSNKQDEENAVNGDSGLSIADKNRVIKDIKTHLNPYKHHTKNGSTIHDQTHQTNQPHGESSNTNTKKDSQQVLMEPIISNLHKKILEASWDPELYKLLDYSPEKVIESIFIEGKGWNDKISKKFGKWEEDEDIDSVRAINGLINEVPYREDLKSWNI